MCYIYKSKYDLKEVKNLKTRKKIIIALILILTVVFSYSSIKGLDLKAFKLNSMSEKMDLGLDLAGGVDVVLEAQTKEDGETLKKKMEQAKTIIRERIDSLGVSEPNITIEGTKRIRAEIAGVEDTQQAIEMIGKTALLEFKNPEGKVIVTGKNIKESNVSYQQGKNNLNQAPVVTLEFDKEGAEKFKAETGRLASLPADQDKSIAIVLDGSLISKPSVNTEISDGRAIIEGNFTIESATELSNLINGGALPLELKEVQSSVIGPTLGLEALDKSILAGVIGLIVIAILMLVLYRLFGLVADLCLVIYILLTLNILSLIGVKLTLPGIAALILSVGMAVDANIVIFERIREEVALGKTIRTAVEAGYKRAITAVIDSNITTLIAGAVLYFFGTGSIKGFGVTLIIGILVSMFTAVVISKFIIKSIVETKIGMRKTIFRSER